MTLKFFATTVWPLAVVSALVGCAHTAPIWPESPTRVKKSTDAASDAPAATPVEGERVLTIAETPKPPEPQRLSTVRPQSGAPAPGGPANITLSFEQISLPAFIQTVYGTLLKQNISIDPAVAQRKELVTLRAGKEQNAADVFNTARVLLKTYGVAIVDAGGLLRAIPDTAATGYAPEIRRGRAAPEVPLPMRPVYQLIEMQSLRVSDVSATLRTMFKDRITLVDDGLRNALLITGQNDDVRAALEAIQVLDQPHMKGRVSLRLNPGFWPVDDMAKRLAEVLTAEGYFVGGAAQSSSAIVFVPVAAVNALIVFAGDQAILSHVAKWAAELDRPNAAARPAGAGYFTYNVQHTDAAALAKTLSEVLGSGGPTAPPRATVPTGSTAADLARAQAELDRQTAARKQSRVVVNAPTNSLIIQGTADDYSQLIPILQDLDRPTRQALIEVTVMDVTLDDEDRLGFQWSAETRRGGSTVSAISPFGGENLFRLSRLNSLGEITARLTAIATEGRGTLVSNPRVMAKNGVTATISVGQEIPTLSSTLGTAGTGANNTTVVQNISYRSVGTILNVKPVIYSNDRIDLEVTQEVSGPGSAGVGGSPGFNTNRISTNLTLKDGESILMGGLIRTNSSVSHSGIPFLKDLPGVGHAFKNSTNTRSRSELVVLITPYIVSDSTDAQRITDEFRKRLGAWAQPPGARPPQPFEVSPNPVVK